MNAQVGDRVVVQEHHVGEHKREGEIVEVHGPDGTPPYMVRWFDTGHEGLMFPGPDARIEHVDRRHAKARSNKHEAGA
jgi:Domain of unknown function (DUF1918)